MQRVVKIIENHLENKNAALLVGIVVVMICCVTNKTHIVYTVNGKGYPAKT